MPGAAMRGALWPLRMRSWTMGARAAMVITCDVAGCDQVIVPMAGPDDNSSRTEARAYARTHGWATANHSASWTDSCPAHTASKSVTSGAC